MIRRTFNLVKPKKQFKKLIQGTITNSRSLLSCPKPTRNFGSSYLDGEQEYEFDNFDQKVNKVNVRISHAINDSKTLNDIIEIHQGNHEWFNLINYSVLFNVLSKIN